MHNNGTHKIGGALIARLFTGHTNRLEQLIGLGSGHLGHRTLNTVPAQTTPLALSQLHRHTDTHGLVTWVHPQSRKSHRYRRNHAQFTATEPSWMQKQTNCQIIVKFESQLFVWRAIQLDSIRWLVRGLGELLF